MQAPSRSQFNTQEGYLLVRLHNYYANLFDRKNVITVLYLTFQFHSNQIVFLYRKVLLAFH